MGGRSSREDFLRKQIDSRACDPSTRLARTPFERCLPNVPNPRTVMRAFLAQSAVKPTEKPRGNDSNTPSPNLSGESQTSGDAQDVREGNGSGSRIGLGISNGGENSRASAGASLSPNQERTNGPDTGHNTRNGRGTGVTTELTRRQLGPLQLKSRSQSPAVKQSSGTPNSSVKRAGDVLEAGKRKRSRGSEIVGHFSASFVATVFLK